MSAARFSIGLAALGVAMPLVAAPGQTSDAKVEQIKDAISRSDGARFAAIDSSVEYIPEWTGRIIPSDLALSLLKGCTFQSARANNWGMTDLEYVCPSRTKKLACTTGDLTVMVYDVGLRTEVGLSEERVFSRRCSRPQAPPPVGSN